MKVFPVSIFPKAFFHCKNLVTKDQSNNFTPPLNSDFQCLISNHINYGDEKASTSQYILELIIIINSKDKLTSFYPLGLWVHPLCTLCTPLCYRPSGQIISSTFILRQMYSVHKRIREIDDLRRIGSFFFKNPFQVHSSLLSVFFSGQCK